MTIEMDSRVFRQIMGNRKTMLANQQQILDNQKAILALLQSQQMKVTTSKYMTEAQVMLLLDLSKRSLQRLRATDVLRVSTATGKKFQYLRSDVEAYQNGCPRAARSPKKKSEYL